MAAGTARAARLLSAHGAALAVAFVALAAWTWGTWPDVLVDFGRECYAPWRLAEGDVLYRDLAWFNGPLSPYVNALAFELGGASLRTLFVANLAVLAGVVAVVWGVRARASTPLAATAACLVVLALCGFGQLVGIGNYNFIAPYSHETTHGLLLGLAALACFERGAARGAERVAGRPDERGAERAGERTERIAWLLGGLCVGLAWLTKPELALAVTAAAAVRLALARDRATTAWVAAAAFAPTLLATALLAPALGAAEAWRGATSAWRGLAASDAAGLDFYTVGMGLDAPLANLGRLAASAAAWLGVVVALGVASFALRSTPLARRAGPWSVAAAAALGAWLLREHVHWLAIARPLPLVALLVLATGWAARRAPERRAGAATRLAFATFALVLLLKMSLNARVQHYGFVLAAPSVALAVVVAVGDLPTWVERLRGSASLARALALAGCALVAAAHLELSDARLAKKTVIVGEGADRFRADVRGEYLNQALAVLAREPADATLAVFPEGVIANFLLRRRNPTPFVNFMPPELVLFGEARIVQAFRDAPPDRVLLVHKDTSEYGFPLFGADYGRELAAWLVATYRPLGPPFGDPPLTPGARFGVQVLGR
ncbi:MAG: hypothetical protein HZA52_01540 [Planctomycetes bacterium]|nr:hypothetical protein [Planctomycetota bacterium]